ncbi:MAG: Gx transporter family protein [Actinomycetota bacterium]
MSSIAETRSNSSIPPSDRRAHLVSRLGLLVALGLILQILEGMLPPLLPLPGAKIGLANLATLVALFVLGPWEALAVNVLRCLLGGLLRGSFVGLTISLAAGTAATLAMMAVYETKPPGITITGLSMAGAVSHNAAQLGVAMWLVGFPGLVNYLPFLLLLALPTGFLIGALARRLLLSLGPRPYLSAAPALHAHPQDHHGEIGQEGPATAYLSYLKERKPGGAISGPSDLKEPAIFMEDVTIWFPGREESPALIDLELRVEEEEFLVITGLNGSGKSTLCRLANGLLLPMRGRVRVHGLDTSWPENLSKIRSMVGMVFQDPDHQLVSATVEDDVAFGPENLGLDRQEIASRVEEAMRRVGISHLRDRQPHLLSLGEKKRVALAGVLAMRPRIILSDESTSMLDPMGRAEFLRLLLRWREEQGVTLVHVTHRPEEFLLADRLVLLERGRLVFDGPPCLFLAQPELRNRIGVREPELLALARELRDRGWALPAFPRETEDLLEGLWASL